MKHGKKPTRKQIIAIQQANLNPENWLIVREFTKEGTLELEHRVTGNTRKIPA